MTSQARWTDVDLASRRPVVGRDAVEPLDDRGLAGAGVGQPRGQAGDRDPAASPCRSGSACPSSVSGTSLAVCGHQLDGGELHRLVVVHPPGQRVADAHLDRGRDRRDGEGDDEARAGGSGRAGPAASPRRRPRRSGSRRRGRPRRACAPPERHRVVEDHPDGSTSTTSPDESSVKPDGAFIQAFAATTETAPKMPASTIGTPVQKCVHGLHPPPAEDVDRDEDRLGEEEEPFERERHPERLAPLAHEPRPEQPELEAQHRAGDRADGERHRHVLRPALGEQQGVGVVVPDARGSWRSAS